MTPANDNGPIRADDFADLAARRAWLASAPATHSPHHEVSPVETWAKRQGDAATFMGLRLWRTLNEPPRLAANDNEPADDIEADEQPASPNMDRELVDVSAKQLIYAHEHGMARWVGNRLVKVWAGHRWTTPDAEFGKVRTRQSEKADTQNWDADLPDAQAELARSMDLERLRKALGHKSAVILDMASGDSRLHQPLCQSGERGLMLTSLNKAASSVETLEDTSPRARPSSWSKHASVGCPVLIETSHF